LIDFDDAAVFNTLMLSQLILYFYRWTWSLCRKPVYKTVN